MEPRQVVNSREEFENRKLSESRGNTMGKSKGDKLRKTGMADQQPTRKLVRRRTTREGKTWDRSGNEEQDKWGKRTGRQMRAVDRHK